ncbi:MAG: hypothetical protein HQK54_06520 [Oligoflexales bacterium]|nr:hypothetical protein [Oligoflexales bacterium]
MASGLCFLLFWAKTLFVSRTIKVSSLMLCGVLLIYAMIYIVFPMSRISVKSFAIEIADHEFAFVKSAFDSAKAKFVPYSSHRDALEAIEKIVPKEVLIREGLWAQGGFCYYYAETGALSPTPFIYAMDYLFSRTPLESRLERISKFKRNLEIKPPALMLFDRFFDKLKENDPIFTNYTRIKRPQIAPIVYLRNDLIFQNKNIKF